MQTEKGWTFELIKILTAFNKIVYYYYYFIYFILFYFLSILKTLGTSIDNLSEKLQLKFQVNPMKIWLNFWQRKFEKRSFEKNVISRKMRLKFHDAFTIWNILTIGLQIFLPLLCYLSTVLLPFHAFILLLSLFSERYKVFSSVSNVSKRFKGLIQCSKAENRLIFKNFFPEKYWI